MRTMLLLSGMALVFLAGLSPLPAQNFDSQDALAVAFPFLTPGQRTELKTAFLTALARDPGLAADWAELLGDMEKPMGHSPAAVEGMRLRIVGFESKVRDAMTENDPGIGTIMDKIDKNMPAVHPELATPSLGRGGSTPTVPGYPASSTGGAH